MLDLLLRVRWKWPTVIWQRGYRERASLRVSDLIRYSLLWNFPKEAGRRAHLLLGPRYSEPWVSILVASKPPWPKR